MDSHIEYEHNLFIKQVSHVNSNITRPYLASICDIFINVFIVSGF